jgi:hypothetical protein
MWGFRWGDVKKELNNAPSAAAVNVGAGFP